MERSIGNPGLLFIFRQRIIEHASPERLNQNNLKSKDKRGETVHALAF
jgi:hypothetical protein